MGQGKWGRGPGGSEQQREKSTDALTLEKVGEGEEGEKIRGDSCNTLGGKKGRKGT